MEACVCWEMRDGVDRALQSWCLVPSKLWGGEKGAARLPRLSLCPFHLRSHLHEKNFPPVPYWGAGGIGDSKSPFPLQGKQLVKKGVLIPTPLTLYNLW